jgi:hypothetical protein
VQGIFSFFGTLNNKHRYSRKKQIIQFSDNARSVMGFVIMVNQRVRVKIITEGQHGQTRRVGTSVHRRAEGRL